MEIIVRDNIMKNFMKDLIFMWKLSEYLTKGNWESVLPSVNT